MLKPFVISSSSDLDRDQLIERLVSMGYERASMVIEQGAYAVKDLLLMFFLVIKISLFDLISFLVNWID